MDRSIVRCVKLNQQTYQLTSVLHPHLTASDIHRFYEIFTIHSSKIFHIYIEKKLIILHPNRWIFVAIFRRIHDIPWILSRQP